MMLNLKIWITTSISWIMFSKFVKSCAVDEEVYIISEVMTNYSKFSLPSRDGVNVSAEFMLNAVTGLSEIRSEFEIDIFFSEIWNDPKLAYSHLNVCAMNVTLDNSYLTQIWQPNICIVNSKKSKIHASPSQNIFLILYSNGRVWRNCRMKVTAPCDIDLQAFPFDQQKCSLIFESYSFNIQKVRLKWFEPNHVTIAGGIDLPDFVLAYYESNYARMEYPNGAWDRLNITFYFNRKYGFFVLQLYIPTYLTIFIAWISLWMDSAELATRATLTISAFLAMTLQFGNILMNMPPVSYIKLIDLFMLGGMMFLFISLAELALISHVTRNDRPLDGFKKPRSKKKSATTQNGDCSGLIPERTFKKHSALSSLSCLRRNVPGPDTLPASSSRHVLRLASPTHANPNLLHCDSEHTYELDYSPSSSISRKTPDQKNLGYRKPSERKLFGRWTPYQIDLFSIIGFTPLFILYNLVYWSLCYISSRHKTSSSQ